MSKNEEIEKSVLNQIIELNSQLNDMLRQPDFDRHKPRIQELRDQYEELVNNFCKDISRH